MLFRSGPARLVIDSIPEPDIARGRRRSYRDGSPRPDDVRLIIEVADSSLRYDRTRRLRRHARASVPEYRVVSVDDEWIEVHRSPAGDWYREVHGAGRGERIAPLEFADISIGVDDGFA